MLRMTCAGMPAKEIAGLLGISKPAVDRRRDAVMVKSGSSGLAQLGVWAERSGYLVALSTEAVQQKSIQSLARAAAGETVRA